MANKRTRAVSKEEFERIISTMRTGFVKPTGERVKPNERIATALVLEANLGLRIGDIVHLHLSDIIYENGRYRLNIREEKTKKLRTFTVPTDIYIYLQTYALEKQLKPTQLLFDVSTRAVQIHLQLVCDYLGISGIGTHSFRKFFAQEIYKNSNFDLTLVQHLLQHSSLAVTQHYLTVDSKQVEDALQNHIFLPA